MQGKGYTMTANVNKSEPSNTAKKVKKTRARPQRRKDAVVEVPIFLRKTYHMIDSSDPIIAGWSDDGETFVVKDPDEFAEKVIPQFFKHNNFSSFVRQLNFYGFRKVKTEPIKIDSLPEDSVESKYWHFRHENFKRGRQDLLVAIRKAKNPPLPDQEEVDDLRSEVVVLKKQLTSMTSQISQLTGLVQMLIDERENSIEPELEPRYIDVADVGQKRKRVDFASPPAVSPSVSPIVHPEPVRSVLLEDVTRASDHDLLLEDSPSVGEEGEIDPFQPGSILPVEERGVRFESFASISSGQGFVNDLLTDPDFFIIPPEKVSSSIPPSLVTSFDNNKTVSTTTGTQTTAELPSDRLQNALATLPLEMQDRFVDSLVEKLTDQFKSVVEAKPSLNPSMVPIEG